jgi:hypothetical protein
MTAFDYGAEAELFSRRSSRPFRPQAVSYRRFAHAADAIRVAIEELPETSLASAYLQVDEERFDSHGMRELYENAEYPLVRRNRERQAAVHAKPAAPRARIARTFVGKRGFVQ